MINIAEFEERIGIRFKDRALLERVFIHRSYLNEHKGLDLEHNERLEFLGDAVLELAVTKYLYDNYDKPEGEMTSWRSALVKGESLSEEAKRLGFNDLMKTSRGEAKNLGKARDLILANAFEALVGAIYLDQGFEVAGDFIQKNVCYKLPTILEKGLYYDPKSRFQELSQEALGVTPTYEVIDEHGPDHAKVFVVGSYLGERKIAEGSGPSKQRAQTEAAREALGVWDEIIKTYNSK
ncbi:MAG: Ribonuclease 3 [bacterium ADurb.Bin400]|nr:MAG: Ribonuclease 3 [bacterium ADurb.Bin400]